MSNRKRCFNLAAMVVVAAGLAGCEVDNRDDPDQPAKPESAKRAIRDLESHDPQLGGKGGDELFKLPKIDAAKPLIKQKGKAVKLADHVFLHITPKGQRRVLVNSFVCMRQGGLEVFMCRLRTKEHESVLTSQADARMIHAALVAAKAKPGSPVKFVPKYRAAHGTAIKITVQYKNKKGKVVSTSAKNWILDVITKKPMKHDWVFAGSRLEKIDPTKPPVYLANDGTVICLSNFDNAMLDLPIKVTEVNANLAFAAWTKRIPAIGTPVQVILEPMLVKKKKK